MTALDVIKCTAMADEIADELIISPKLYKAFKQIPRAMFVPVSMHAYKLDAQPIGSNQWISSPLTVAKMTSALEADDVDNVLEIGCGSGYQAAILSKLAHRVFTIERIQKLVSDAKSLFEKLNIKNVHVRYDDGNNGWKSYAPYDRILLSATANEIPQRLFDQLKNGGILVAPMVKDERQFIFKFKKDMQGGIEKIQLDECFFVPLLTGRE